MSRYPRILVSCIFGILFIVHFADRGEYFESLANNSSNFYLCIFRGDLVAWPDDCFSSLKIF